MTPEIEDSGNARPITRRAFLVASAALPLIATAAGRAGAGTTTIPQTPALSAPTVPAVTARARSVSKAPTLDASQAATFVKHGPRTSKVVALTFHGAGSPVLAKQVLALTKHLHTPVTIFAVGNWVQANPDLAKTFAADGHELANHTFSHPALRRLNRSAVAAEIAGGAEALRNATGNIGAWFRPSGTPTPTTLMLEEAAKVGYETVVGYDVDPLDYQDPGSHLLIARTTSAIKSGSIVSLHLGHQGTVDALEPIIVEIRRLGLELATVSTVLKG